MAPTTIKAHLFAVSDSIHRDRFRTPNTSNKSRWIATKRDPRGTPFLPRADALVVRCLDPNAVDWPAVVLQRGLERLAGLADAPDPHEALGAAADDLAAVR